VLICLKHHPRLRKAKVDDRELQWQSQVKSGGKKISPKLKPQIMFVFSS